MRKKFFSLLLSTVLVASLCFAAISVARILVNSSDEWSESEPEIILNLGSPYKHSYEKLTSVRKHIYNEILKNVYSMPEKIEIPLAEKEDVEAVFSALLADNPDLYFVKNIPGMESYGFKNYVCMEYTMSQDEYREADAKIKAVCDKVVSGLTDAENEWQTELEIHDYIINNCEYKFDSENGLDYSTVYSVFVNGEAACEGYSKAAKMLFDEAGIESMTVTGNGINSEGSVRHMWNIVCIDGGYYHLDCTWDDPVMNGVPDSETEALVYKQSHAYDYFNVSDEMVKETHEADEKTVSCHSTDAYYYKKTGVYFDSYDKKTEEKILNLVEEAVDGGKEYAVFRFANNEAYDYAVNKSDMSKKLNSLINNKHQKIAGFGVWHTSDNYTVMIVIDYK